MTGSAAESRLIASDVRAIQMLPDDASEEFSTADQPMDLTSGTLVGLWEAGPGEANDVEAEETFLVLSGAGNVTFEDGSRIDLVPGVLVHLREGDRTRWQISSVLRKLYITYEVAQPDAVPDGG